MRQGQPFGPNEKLRLSSGIWARFSPPAVFGLLVVYCLRNVDLFSGNHGIPEFIGLASTVLTHVTSKKMPVAMTVGTVLYMILLQFVF